MFGTEQSVKHKLHFFENKFGKVVAGQLEGDLHDNVDSS